MVFKLSLVDSLEVPSEPEEPTMKVIVVCLSFYILGSAPNKSTLHLKSLNANSIDQNFLYVFNHTHELFFPPKLLFFFCFVLFLMGEAGGIHFVT